MRNNRVLAAMVVLGLAVPGAFFAGYLVSERSERTNGMPTGPDASLGTNGVEETASAQFFVGAGTQVEQRATVSGGEMRNCIDKEHKEWIVPDGRDEIDVLAFLVPPDWDGVLPVCGEAEGKRVHNPLTSAVDKATPKLFIAMAKEAQEETRAVDMYLKMDIIESMEEVSFTYQKIDWSSVARTWLNLTVSWGGGPSTTGGEADAQDLRFSVEFVVPVEQVSLNKQDAASPKLFLEVGAHPDVDLDGATIAYVLFVYTMEDVIITATWSRAENKKE